MQFTRIGQVQGADSSTGWIASANSSNIPPAGSTHGLTAQGGSEISGSRAPYASGLRPSASNTEGHGIRRRKAGRAPCSTARVSKPSGISLPCHLGMVVVEMRAGRRRERAGRTGAATSFPSPVRGFEVAGTAPPHIRIALVVVRARRKNHRSIDCPGAPEGALKPGSLQTLGVVQTLAGSTANAMDVGLLQQQPPRSRRTRDRGDAVKYGRCFVNRHRAAAMRNRIGVKPGSARPPSHSR